jgi:hypothetical protein
MKARTARVVDGLQVVWDLSLEIMIKILSLSIHIKKQKQCLPLPLCVAFNVVKNSIHLGSKYKYSVAGVT